MSLPKNIDQSKSNPVIGSAELKDEIQPTLCATITGRGRSAIGVVGIAGSQAGHIVSHCFDGATKSGFSQDEIRFGWWTGKDGGRSGAESVVIAPLGNNRFEVHCHGGPAALARILDDVQACGASRLETEDRSLGFQPLLIDEATRVLCRCQTARMAAIALDQVRGAMLDWATGWLKRPLPQPDHAEEIRRQASRILGSAELTTRLTEPFRLVLIGPPNVGKSTLLNAIVGYSRSITFDAPGTTRDVLHAETVVDGLPLRLSDTAGLRTRADETIEQQGIERAREVAGEADLLLRVTEPVGSSTTPAPPLPASKPVIRVLNKADLLPVGDRRPVAGGKDYDAATSAVSGDGVPELLDLIAARLGASLPGPGEPVAITQRQAACIGKVATAVNDESIDASLRELIGDRLP